MAERKSAGESPATTGTLIGENIQVRGRIEGEEDLHVRGSVEGEISLSETLFVEEGGVVQASVEARDVVVWGVLVGDVIAMDRIVLNAGSSLVGNIKAPRVVIADGAAFRGEIVMGEPARVSAPHDMRASKSTGRRSVRSGDIPTKAAQTNVAARRGGESGSKTPIRRQQPARVAPRPIVKARDESNDEEVTVVLKHTNLRRGVSANEETVGLAKNPQRRAVAPAKKSTKKTAKARVPARGKKRIARR